MNVALSLLCFLAGIGIPVMATMNGVVGAGFGNVFAATTLLCLVAFVVCLIVFQGFASEIRHNDAAIPGYFYFAGALFVFYILTITTSAKYLGLANVIFLVLLGQMVCATLIDHYGLFGAKIIRLDMNRLMGLMLILLGIYLLRK